MTFATLLTDCSAAGVRLTNDGGRLVADGPRGAVTPALVDGLKAHKPDLLVALAPPAGPCPRCGSAILVRLVTGPTVCLGCTPVTGAPVLRKLVWNDELCTAEPYADALRASRAERTAPRAQFAPNAGRRCPPVRPVRV